MRVFVNLTVCVLMSADALPLYAEPPDEIRAVTADAARELVGKSQSDSALSLRSVTELSVEVAAILAKHDGNLSLDGLKLLSSDSARALSQHKKWKLSLNGLS